MTKQAKQEPTLVRASTYQIRVPGELDESWSDWPEGITLTVEVKGEGQRTTTLTGKLDQAALQGVLRSLYALGLPLISAVCVECACEDSDYFPGA